MNTKSQTAMKKYELSPTPAEPDAQGTVQNDLETRIRNLEVQVSTLQARCQQFLKMDDLVFRLAGSQPEKRKARKKREYTDEERMAIRERLMEGKLAKQKMLEN